MYIINAGVQFMISKISFKNFKTFTERTSISFVATPIKRFLCNTTDMPNKKILKTIGIYGPNNTGKTCAILAIANLANIMLGRPHENLSNSFIDDDVIEYEVEYYIDKQFYRYYVQYDCKNNKYIQEQLLSLTTQESNPSVISEKVLIKRDQDGITISGSRQSKDLAVLLANNNPIIMTVRFSEGSLLDIAKKHYIEFANSIVPLRMDLSIDPSKTIELFRTDEKAAKFIKEFVKNCDLHIEDFSWDDNFRTDVDISDKLPGMQINNELKFTSRHYGHYVPSFIFDSVGTKKLIAISGYIYDAIKNGKLLLIDEIDSSLHHIITKALVAMFNNSLNELSQLVFTTHDVLLLDLKHLMRKDQIYLTDIDDNKNASIVIRLSDISSKEENGIRGDEDIVDYYLKGRFGAIPSPDLFDALVEATTND